MTKLAAIRNKEQLTVDSLARLTGIEAVLIVEAEDRTNSLDRDEQLTLAGFFGVSHTDLFDRNGMARVRDSRSCWVPA